MSAWLLVDAGNTRVKWALAADDAPLGQWLAEGAVDHADVETLAATWRTAAVARVLVSNVAGAALAQVLGEQLATAVPAVPVEWFASSASCAGVVNGYREPGRLGCDRFAAAIGAHALLPGQDVVVANCGTATTVDAVTADGRFAGGMILPGLGLMSRSLARNTAQLPQIAPGAAVPPVFADNTDDAILSGCLSAQAGAIERAVAAHGGAACIISGGAAAYVAPALAIPARHVDNIVMTGLHAVLRAARTDGRC